MAISYGGIMSALQQRQMAIAQDKLRRQQEKQQQLKMMMALGGMAAGGLAGAGVFGPAMGAGLAGGGAGGAGLGSTLSGMGMGMSIGGLAGGAISGAGVSPGEVMGGLGLAGNIFGRQQQLDAMEKYRQDTLDLRKEKLKLDQAEFDWEKNYGRGRGGLGGLTTPGLTRSALRTYDTDTPVKLGKETFRYGDEGYDHAMQSRYGVPLRQLESLGGPYTEVPGLKRKGLFGIDRLKADYDPFSVSPYQQRVPSTLPTTEDQYQRYQDYTRAPPLVRPEAIPTKLPAPAPIATPTPANERQLAINALREAGIDITEENINYYLKKLYGR